MEIKFILDNLNKKLEHWQEFLKAAQQDVLICRDKIRSIENTIHILKEKGGV